MVNLANYKTIIDFTVRKYFKKYEDIQDSTQLAMIKIFEVSKREKTLEIETVQTRAYVRKIVTNLMLDLLRKQNLENRYFDKKMIFDEDYAQTKAPFKKPMDSAFDKMACDEALRELEHFLDPIESRILHEMLNPSEEFCWYERQKKAVNRMYAKSIKRGFIRTASSGKELCISDYDESLAQFLHMDQKSFMQKTSNIKTIFANLNEAA